MSFPFLDVAIGLILVYLGASLFVTVANEAVAQWLDLRGKALARSLARLFETGQLRLAAAEHPMLKPLLSTLDGAAGATYVDANTLARALIGAAAPGGGAAAPTVGSVAAAAGLLPDSGIRSALLSFAATAGGDINKLVADLGHWIEESLTTLGESYKRMAQRNSLAVALGLAVFLNIDMIAITKALYQNPALREAMVREAAALVEKADSEALNKCLTLDAAARQADEKCRILFSLAEGLQSKSGTLGQLPIGWGSTTATAKEAVMTDDGRLNRAWIWAAISAVAGWVLSALAISLGAPFWFELLNRLVNLRYGRAKPAR